MNNLQKRILTSIIILPLSIFFIVKGGKFLTFFLIFVLFAGIHELYYVFKKIIILTSSTFSFFCQFHIIEKIQNRMPKLQENGAKMMKN